MNPINEKPRINVKSKNLQIVIDYCIEQKTEFTVIPRNSINDEWEVELNIKSISKAIEWGMFIKTNKLGFAVNELFNKPVATVQKTRTRGKKTSITNVTDEIKNEENESVVSYKKQSNQNNTLSFE